MIFKFYFKKPPLVIVSDEKTRKFLKDIVSFYFVVSEKKISFFKEIVLILKPFSEIKFFIRHSRLPVLIPDSESKELRSFVPPLGYLVSNYDKESFGKEVLAKTVTYGFKEGADFLITDLNFLNQEVNFKINYEGNSVPFWVKNIEEKKQVFAVVSAIVAGFCLGLNLVEISKTFQEKQ